MMASSEFQSDGVLLDQIDSALSLWNHGLSVTDIEDETHSKPKSFNEMELMYNARISELYNHQEVLSALTFGESVCKSKILRDETLLEAILFSKIFENSSEFDSNRGECAGKIVWVRKEGSDFVNLISQNQIVYVMYVNTLRTIRFKVQNFWVCFFLKQKVKKNLKAVQVPASQDWSKYVSDAQSSFGAAPSASSAVSDAHPLKYPLTEELKTIFLDELNSFHLDPAIKQKFVFDLKVMPDKDLVYWRERLDHLRSSSSVASSQELQRLSQAVADLEKLVREKSAETSTLAETLPKLEEMMAAQVSDGTVNEANGEKLQQLVDSLSALARTVEGNETCLAKMSDQLSATVKTDLKEIIGEFKTDLIESKNCNPGTSEVFTESKLDEMLEDFEKVEVLIRDIMISGQNAAAIMLSAQNAPALPNRIIFSQFISFKTKIHDYEGPLKTLVKNLREKVKILRDSVQVIPKES